jgi:hypothetical protein
MPTLLAVLVGLAAVSGVAQQGSAANVDPTSSADDEKPPCESDAAPGRGVRGGGTSLRRADADLKHALTGRRCEAGELMNVGFELIARAGVGREVGLIAEVARAAGIGVPEIAHGEFQRLGFF